MRHKRHKKVRTFAKLLICGVLFFSAGVISGLASELQSFVVPANAADDTAPGQTVHHAETDPLSDNTDWMLTLVNAENPLPEDYLPKLESLQNGLKFDERAAERLNAMLSDARAVGLSPVVCSAYRTVEKQRELYDNQVEAQKAKGLNNRQAEIEALKSVAFPGTSEHGLGLAADIVSKGYQHLDDEQANTFEAKWLLEHCSEYGFILRYPKDKTDITGITYEPWHYRYVGELAAKDIMESNLCLEEYLSERSSLRN